jgi:hypothetical protein
MGLAYAAASENVIIPEEHTRMNELQLSLKNDKPTEYRSVREIDYRMLAPDLKKLIDGKSSKTSAENRAAGRDRKTNTTP